MNVVFFDVDGVLNSEKFLCEKHGEFINPKNVANLKMVVDATGAKLVMTSDWRKQVIDKDISKAHVRELIDRLADAGMEVYGATSSGDELRNKYGDYTRACAVKDYVAANLMTWIWTGRLMNSILTGSTQRTYLWGCLRQMP